MSKKPKMVSVHVPAALSELDRCTVDQLVIWATQIRDQVPAEHRAASRVEFRAYDHEIEGDVWYDRPETADDRRRTEAENKQRIHDHEAWIEAQDLAEYRRLKAKYGKQQP